jgi:hypothetical protein
VNAVASGFGAHVKHRIADAGSLSEEDLIVSHETECKRIDERIQRVRIVKSDFTADGRNTKRVAIMSNAGNDAGK